jgi:ubiquinone/menaquinone biosynthesis C-methylase UbiE
MLQATGKNNVNVVELGSGTGIFTRLLLPRPDVKSILAVDPSDGMRTGFRSAVLDKLPSNLGDKVKLVPGTFTQVPTEEASADLLVIAQAFHWIGDQPKDHEAALQEFARELLQLASSSPDFDCGRHSSPGRHCRCTWPRLD